MQKKVMTIINRIQKASILRLIAYYIAIKIAIFVLGVVLFYFPILPLYSLLGKEFSNLGPIPTGIWGAMVDVVVITPAFLIVVIIKIIMAYRNRDISR